MDLTTLEEGTPSLSRNVGKHISTLQKNLTHACCGENLKMCVVSCSSLQGWEECSFERGREMSVSITDMEFSNSSSGVKRFSVRTLLRYVRFYVWFSDILFPQKLKKEDPIHTHSSTCSLD
jgi:hypothetical protein